MIAIARLRLLSFITELNADVSTLCYHLRNKEYTPNSPQLYNAMSSLVYYQILVDELDLLLTAQKQIVNAMESYLQGEDFYQDDADESETIYTYCLQYFTRPDCPLGSATPELSLWVATHADRKKRLIDDLFHIAPDMQLLIPDPEADSETGLRPANEEERFKSETEQYLRNIESSNALVEFNQLMQEVRGMLEAERSIDSILLAIKREFSD